MESAIAALDKVLPNLTAAIIAAVLGFVGLVIAKENKTSEFRQQWIDALRQDIAEYVAAVRVMAQSNPGFRTIDATVEQQIQHAKELRGVHLQSSSALARIRLRLNPDDPNPKLKALNKQLLDKIKEAQVHLAEERYHDALVVTNHLHLQAGPVLKLEWERVKRGEEIYQFAKWGTLVFLLALLALTIAGYVVRGIIAVN